MNAYHAGNSQPRPILIERRNPEPDWGAIDETVHGAWGLTVCATEFEK